jgi:predicted phosphodiesterase
VLALKDKVQKERLVLYRDFSTTREFKALVEKLLETHISGLIKGWSPKRKEETAAAPEDGTVAAAMTDKQPVTTIDVKKDPAKLDLSPRSLTILHISDLHIKKGEYFDRSIVFDPLLWRLKLDAEENNLNPRLVVVSGDLSRQGSKEEYAQATLFFTRLLAVLCLKNENLFFVPGNHDMDRSKYQPSDILVYTDIKALNDELENKDYRTDLLKGQAGFFSFMKQGYPHLQPVDDNLVPFVCSPKTPLSGNVALVGLNSAWMCRKSDDREEIAIGEYQLKKALDEVKKKAGTFALSSTCSTTPLNGLCQGTGAGYLPAIVMTNTDLST